MRHSVAWFAEEMERKLSANDHKGGWENIPYLDLFTMLLDEVRELHEAIVNLKMPDGVIDECADVANFAMMIADRAAAHTIRERTNGIRHSGVD